MSLGIAGELQFFGLSLLRGILILLLYDLLRIFRRVVSHGTFAVAVEDICYWLITALLIFQLIYRENDGAIRGYAIAALVMGMVLYYFTLSKYLVNGISWVLKKILSFLLKPVHFLWKKVVQAGKAAFRFYKKKLKKRWKELIIILFS